MEAENAIVSEIFKGVSFSPKEINFIYNKLEKIVLSKGDILISPNTFVDKQFYVKKGCLRSYFIDPTGKEHTIQFAIQDWWISDFTSLFTSEKSILTVECLQDVVVYQFSKENFNDLSALFPEIEFFRRDKLERAYASFQKRILDNLANSARDRYLLFIKKYPTILKNVKNYHIASYLGITTESLSRIRKTIS